MVVASWQRSLDLNVDAGRLRAPYRENANLDVPLMRAARPILERLHQVLADEPVSTMVTDKDGLILAREISHAGMLTRLNRVSLVPGHVFSEEFVGTNGIGTALASGRSAIIRGAEHFVEELLPFYCTAVPIFHPTRRTIMGTFNLTSSSDANSGHMALALASSMALQIENEVGRISSQREYLLFEAYMSACRGSRPIAVLALNDEVTMMNDKLRTVVLGSDQDSLLSHARESLSERNPQPTRTITLPSGRLIELRTVGSDDHHDGGQVFQIHVVRAHQRADQSAARPRPLMLTDVVGSMPSWVSAVARLQAAYISRVPTAILGEPGVGKVHVLTAIHRSSGMHGATIVLEPPSDGDVGSHWLDAFVEAISHRDNVVIIRNIHWMAPAIRSRIASMLAEAVPYDTARIFVTVLPQVISPDDELLSQCDELIELPPIRHRRDDISRLIRYFSRRFRPTGDLVLTPEAEQVLLNYAWPNNVRQIETVVRNLGRQRSLRTVRVDDLPPECKVTSHASLTILESLERDTIIRVLIEQGCNVHQSAMRLGIARATIYRKMRRYGIDPALL